MIDLCNKMEQVRIGDSEAVLKNHFADALKSTSAPLDALTVDQREVVELAYFSALAHPNPLMHVVGDPAAWESNFAHALDRIAVRIDRRTNEELRHAALTHRDPMMREQAIFEYADRNPTDALAFISQAIRSETHQEVRWNSLWAIEKLGGVEAIKTLREFTSDKDLEIAEWASLFIHELQTGEPTFDERSCRHTKGRTFDETIHLLIHCDLFIRLETSNQIWGKLTLSPQALARIYGQAHACPNARSRERQLVIAKTIEHLHADGSPHVDNYLFRGFTERTRSDRGNFYFESSVDRPFFLSGKADDASEGVHDGHVAFMREGCWYLDSRFKIPQQDGEPADAIRYVRGRFQGWGYTNLEKLQGKTLDEILTPGNGVLSNLHDPITGPLTNIFIAGTFKGKLNDWDGDGYIDLNSRNVYSTTEGELDTNMDGIPDAPGVSCCENRNNFPL
jgi:hypothetical protein